MAALLAAILLAILIAVIIMMGKWNDRTYARLRLLQKSLFLSCSLASKSENINVDE